MRDIAPDLPRIPVHDVGPHFPMATLGAETARAHALLDAATRRVPRAALRTLDAISRRWLAKWDNAHLGEIDAIARHLGRPGAYFLSVNYEWGCTVGVRASPDGRSALLVRVLDWATPGLGRNVIAARVGGAPAGPFVTLTWPGYTGILQAMAPGRFSAALNQAPMPMPVGLYLLDWAANRARVWRQPHTTPAHLLRSVFEEARSFTEARERLAATPIASPCIYSLAGLSPAETCIIERTETAVQVHDGPGTAANHWQAQGWRGRPRGVDSAGRASMMQIMDAGLDGGFDWLGWPIRNERTRLAMVADAAAGRVAAQGFERNGPATAALHLAAATAGLGSDPN
jgi:hypothetical protein